MTITCVQGTPGSGKSAVTIADLGEFLTAGGWVGANFKLLPGWLDIICASVPRYHVMTRNQQNEYRRDIYERCFLVGNSQTAYEMSKKMVEKVGKVKEGMGRLYLDEAQLFFNSRHWQKNFGYIEFFTQHRKLGFDVQLITHSMEMIDAQIRPLIEIDRRLRNMKNVKIPFLGIPISPIPLFLTIDRYAGISAGAGVIAGRRLYVLHAQYKNLYDTLAVFAHDNLSEKLEYQGTYTKEHRSLSVFDRLRSVLGLALETPSNQTVDKAPDLSPRVIDYFERVLPES